MIVTALVTAQTGKPTFEQVQEEHKRHHFGVNRTSELLQVKYGDAVSRRMVRKVVTRCTECARLDPTMCFHRIAHSRINYCYR